MRRWHVAFRLDRLQIDLAGRRPPRSGVCSSWCALICDDEVEFLLRRCGLDLALPLDEPNEDLVDLGSRNVWGLREDLGVARELQVRRDNVLMRRDLLVR